MTKTQINIWLALVDKCRVEFASSDLSLRRRDAILATHNLLLHYEKELTRIKLCPQYGQMFAVDALELGNIPITPYTRSGKE